MTLRGRAAQFAPFAALTGFDEQVDESARKTDARLTPDEDAMIKINEVLADICEHPGKRVTVTYFVPDTKKSGGAYITRELCARHLDIGQRVIHFYGGEAVSIDDIYYICPSV